MTLTMLGWPELIGIFVMLMVIPISIACFAFWLWMLIHAVKNKGLSDGEKIAWVLIIALISFLGPIIYFFVGKPKDKSPLPAPMTLQT